MSVFNEAWKEMGSDAAAAQFRRTIEYLLRGTSPSALEDCVTAFINDATPNAMKGSKESLLTKVLCIAYPKEYLTILTLAQGRKAISGPDWTVDTLPS